jgi:hypothetical protein
MYGWIKSKGNCWQTWEARGSGEMLQTGGSGAEAWGTGGADYLPYSPNFR